MKKTINLKTISILALLLSFVSYANAVDIPTVDDLNKQVPQLPSEKEPDASEILGKTDEKVFEEDEEKILKVLVKDFKINGNKKYDDKILKDLVKESINQELDYDALLKVTTIISVSPNCFPSSSWAIALIPGVLLKFLIFLSN